MIYSEMIEDIKNVGGGILSVVLVAWMISEIVNINPSAFGDFTLNVIGVTLLLLMPTGIGVLWKLVD